MNLCQLDLVVNPAEMEKHPRWEVKGLERSTIKSIWTYIHLSRSPPTYKAEDEDQTIEDG